MAVQQLNKRIMKEIEAGYKSTEFKFFHDADEKYGDRNACYLKFQIKSGIYVNQIHILQFKFMYGANQKYCFPKNPPNVLFMTPIYHTNIASSGSICLDVIKDDVWSPLYGIETIFNSILALLEDPNTKSPFNQEAMLQYLKHEKNLKEYEKICYDHYIKNIKNLGHDLLKSTEFDY